MSSSTSVPARTNHRHIGARLDREWARLHRHERSLATVRIWAMRESDPDLARLFAEARDLDHLVAATRGEPAASADRVLGRLVDLARSDELAGRILIQRLLPAVIVHSRRYGSLDRNLESIDHAIGALWIAIRRYDTARRTRHVAAALISDAMWEAFRRQARRRSDRELAIPISAPHSPEPDESRREPLVELAETLREAARAGVGAEHLDILRALAADASPRELADACGVTTRTIRNRRRRAVDRVRSSLISAA